MKLSRALQALDSLAAEEALDEVSSATERLLSRTREPRSEAALRLSRGRAELRVGRVREAARDLEAARSRFADVGDELGVVDCAGWHAAALAALEEPQALGVAREAVRRASALAELPDGMKARLLATEGEILVSRHEWRDAAGRLRAALAAGGRVVDVCWLALVESRLALASVAIGDLGRARSSLARACSLRPMVRRPLDRVRVDTAIGLATLRTGLADEAEPLLRAARRLADEQPCPVGRAAMLLALAELGWTRGDVASVHVLAQLARASAERAAQRLSLADAHVWLARAAGARGDHPAADAAFERALRLLRAVGADTRLAGCHAELAQTLEERGATLAALHHWKRAAQLSRR